MAHTKCSEWAKNLFLANLKLADILEEIKPLMGLKGLENS